jgi:hypothetical protein
MLEHVLTKWRLVVRSYPAAAAAAAGRDSLRKTGLMMQVAAVVGDEDGCSCRKSCCIPFNFKVNPEFLPSFDGTSIKTMMR